MNHTTVQLTHSDFTGAHFSAEVDLCLMTFTKGWNKLFISLFICLFISYISSEDYTKSLYSLQMIIRSCHLFKCEFFHSFFKHIDHYSRTKAIAEHMVLAANGRSTKGTEMETCWSLKSILLLRTIAISASGVMYPDHIVCVCVDVCRCVCVHCWWGTEVMAAMVMTTACNPTQPDLLTLF